MRDTTALQKEYDGNEDIVIDDVTSVASAFKLPVRNWNLIIDSYNTSHKKNFPFSALECRMVVEYVKKGIPPKHIFQTLGISSQRYTSMVGKCSDFEDRLIELGGKENRSEDDYNEFQEIMRNPYRLLMSDIDRAQGASNLKDWERYNEMAYSATDIMAMKMKAKFRDFFEDKDSTTATNNIVINVGPGFLEEL